MDTLKNVIEITDSEDSNDSNIFKTDGNVDCVGSNDDTLQLAEKTLNIVNKELLITEEKPIEFGYTNDTQSQIEENSCLKELLLSKKGIEYLHESNNSAQNTNKYGMILSKPFPADQFYPHTEVQTEKNIFRIDPKTKHITLVQNQGSKETLKRKANDTLYILPDDESGAAKKPLAISKLDDLVKSVSKENKNGKTLLIKLQKISEQEADELVNENQQLRIVEIPKMPKQPTNIDPQQKKNKHIAISPKPRPNYIAIAPKPRVSIENLVAVKPLKSIATVSPKRAEIWTKKAATAAITASAACLPKPKAGKSLEVVNTVMLNTEDHNDSKPDASDEYETFGKHVASQLRQLSMDSNVLAQVEIQKILSTYRIKDLKKSKT